MVRADTPTPGDGEPHRCGRITTRPRGGVRRPCGEALPQHPAARFVPFAHDGHRRRSRRVPRPDQPARRESHSAARRGRCGRHREVCLRDHEALRTHGWRHRAGAGEPGAEVRAGGRRRDARGEAAVRGRRVATENHLAPSEDRSIRMVAPVETTDPDIRVPVMRRVPPQAGTAGEMLHVRDVPCLSVYERT